jgi:hypothetical protein
LSSLFAGFVSTGVMTILKIPFWKRWGLTGILEWHENQILTCKFFRLASNNIHFWGIFLLHFLNGSLGGIGLLLAFILIPTLKVIPLLPLAVLYGSFLWILTLVPIHKPITGINPWNHPLGKGPAVVIWVGHTIYGITLVIFFTLIITI